MKESILEHDTRHFSFFFSYEIPSSYSAPQCSFSGIAILLVIFRVPHSQTILSEESKIPIPNSSETAMGQKTEPSFNFSEHSPPELSGLSNWINSPGFSSIQELKGKVVLVDFWTIHVLTAFEHFPILKVGTKKYADQRGLSFGNSYARICLWAYSRKRSGRL